jgi:sulfur carrier protein ThiS
MRVAVKLPRHLTDEMKVAHEVELSDRSTILDLLRSVGVRPDEVLVVMGAVPVPVDRVLHDGERVELLSIVSGG